MRSTVKRNVGCPFVFIWIQKNLLFLVSRKVRELPSSSRSNRNHFSTRHKIRFQKTCFVDICFPHESTRTEGSPIWESLYETFDSKTQTIAPLFHKRLSETGSWISSKRYQYDEEWKYGHVRNTHSSKFSSTKVLQFSPRKSSKLCCTLNVVPTFRWTVKRKTFSRPRVLSQGKKNHRN